MSAHHAHDASVDVRERGAERNGQPQVMDRRLFVQLLVYTCPAELGPTHALERLGAAFARGSTPTVLYEDVNDPRGIAVLTWSEDPEKLVRATRSVLGEDACAALHQRHEMTMLGRTYSSGFEDDLEYWLLRRPHETLLNQAWPWAVWYPLRRSGAFERLDPKEKAAIMREHAGIGKAYGAADLAHDVRLACHGIDANDNEFVIGLVGRELHPLSHIVQAMRRTRQTSEFITQMGPFFVGRAVFRHAG